MVKQFPSGVLTGKHIQDLFAHAKANNFAIPGVNVLGSHTINAVLETAAICKAPVIIQCTHAGSLFFIGKSIDNTNEAAAINGAIAAAHYVHYAAKVYKVPVILHSDHCSKSKLPWVDGMLAASESHFAATGMPLFSSHMIDLSDRPIEENIELCKKYLKRMKPLGITLEIELGVTGGVEDDMDNTNVEQSKLYTQPKEVAYAYEELMSISNQFTIAASFGNVHGVYNQAT